MSLSKITLIGIENYLNSNNQSLFDNIVLPAEIDKNILLNTILIRGGEFESLYGDANFIKDAVDLFFKKWNRTFNEWLKGTKSTFNPIENYDRYEEFIDSVHTDDSQQISSSNTVSQQTDVSAFDSSSFQPNEKISSNNGNTANTTANTEQTNTHNAHIHGNIGVTTSSAMLSEFYDIAKWNLYEHIADIFISEFCVMVYT